MHSYLLNYVLVGEQLNTSTSLPLRKEPPEPIGYGTGWDADKSETKEFTAHAGCKPPNLRLPSHYHSYLKAHHKAHT
jgi:hypothetical protein